MKASNFPQVECLFIASCTISAFGRGSQQMEVCTRAHHQEPATASHCRLLAMGSWYVPFLHLGGDRDSDSEVSKPRTQHNNPDQGSIILNPDNSTLFPTSSCKLSGSLGQRIFGHLPRRLTSVYYSVTSVTKRAIFYSIS